MAPGPQFKINLLGRFEIFAPDGRGIEISARKTRALLAYLAMTPGRAQGRDRLIGLLWRDRGEAQARSSLRQALSDIARAFDGLPSMPLIKGGDTLALDGGLVDVDVQEFERLSASASRGDLERAVALYAGDLLDGTAIQDSGFEEWLGPERQRLRDLDAGILVKLLAEAQGERLIELARKLLALDRFREDGHRALMRAHAENGEISAALRQYEECRQLLKRELDASPSAETEALHRRIRQQAGSERQIGAPLSADQAVARGAGLPSLAVLPFRNLGGDYEQLYLSDGITEDIITELSRFKELFVIARTSSFQYRGQAKDAKVIAGELGVSYLVEGSVRKAGNRIRVSAQLIEAQSGNNLWAEHYDRDAVDIFDVQDDVVRTIVATLVGRVVASGADKSRRKPARDWAAYDYFLQGRERFDEHDSPSAMQLFQRAIESDPDFAQARAWLSYAHTTSFFFTGDVDLLKQAEKQARRALELDGTDAHSHSALGLAQLFMRQYEDAGVHLALAVELNPSNARVMMPLSVWFGFMNRNDEALALLESCLRRDPFAGEWYWEGVSASLFHARRYEEAIQALTRMKHKLVWNHYLLAAAYAYLGRKEEATAQAQEVLRLKPDYSETWVIAIEPYKDFARVEHLLTGLRLAGLPSAR